MKIQANLWIHTKFSWLLNFFHQPTITAISWLPSLISQLFFPCSFFGWPHPFLQPGCFCADITSFANPQASLLPSRSWYTLYVTCWVKTHRFCKKYIFPIKMHWNLIVNYTCTSKKIMHVVIALISNKELLKPTITRHHWTPQLIRSTKIFVWCW